MRRLRLALDIEKIMIEAPLTNLDVSKLPSASFFMPDTPSKLFHYTSLNGLRGIIDSRSIWLTRAAFLNDRTELKHAIEIFQEEAEYAASGNHYDDDAVGIIRLAARQLISFENTNICLASFCEDGDLLSQWRGYGNQGNGVAIGFNGSILAKANDNGWAKLVKCIYKPEVKKLIIRDLITALHDSYCKARIDLQEEYLSNLKRNVVGFFNTVFLQIAPALKDEGFQEEQEWRIVTLPRSILDPNFKANLSNERVMQYYDYHLNREPSEFISSLTVGPNSLQSLMPDAIQSYARMRGTAIGNIVFSRIPYRG